MIYRILIVFFLIGLSSKVYSQTSLVPGDIAIFWNQTDSPPGFDDNFAFVTFVDMAAGTVIYFTDCGADAAGFNTPCIEGAFRYTVPAGGITTGDIIRTDVNAADFTTYNDTRIIGGFATSTSGDQVIAFQDASFPGGSPNAGNNPAFIFASNTASTLFTGDKTDSNETGLPAGLSDTASLRTALGVGAGPGVDTEVDNSIYNGSYDFSSGGIPAAKLAFTNPANYYDTNTNPPGDPTYNALIAAIPTEITLTASCAATDTTPPVPDVAVLPDVTAQCQVTSLTPPTATDNCGGPVIVTNNASLPITTQGTTVVTWTYDDGNGNTSTQNQNVVIDDTTNPVPDAASLPDITAQCQVTSLTPPTATDNCGGAITVTNNASLPITAQGTTLVTWTFNDGNGNTSTQNQNIVIDDLSPPVPDAAVLPDITAECQITALIPPTATDNCGGAIIVTNNASLPITAQGTTLVTWTFNDGNGNTSTQNQNIVIDDMGPTIICLDVVVDFNGEEMISVFIDELYDANASFDNCSPITLLTSDQTVTCDQIGEVITVSVEGSDDAGNVSTCSANITVGGLPCDWTNTNGIGCDGDNNASFDTNTETFTLTSDECSPSFPYISDNQGFIYQELCGEGYIKALVTNVNGNGFAGVEVRNSLDPNSKKIAIGTNKVNRIIRMARVIEGYPAWPQEVFSLDKFWVKIERSGSYFRALASTDDINYIPYLFQAIPMEECTKVGLFVHSKVPGAIVTADFTNVEIGQAVPLIEDPSKNGTVMSTPMSAQINVGLSPNPAKDELRIDLHSLIAQDVSIRIYNINCQLMTNRQSDYVENATEIIAIDHFPAGTYYVHVKTAQQQQTLKLVKQ